MNADQFLVDSGWKQVADETGECLFVLLPDQTTYMWGDVEQEKDHIAAAKAYHPAMAPISPPSVSSIWWAMEPAQPP